MTAYHAWQPLFFHLNGAGYSLYAYEVDTVIPITTYADKDKVASNTWPVILDDDGLGNGVAPVYIDETYATLDLRNLEDVSVDGYPANWVKSAQQDEVDAIDARLVLNEATDVAQTNAIDIAQDDIVALDVRLDAAEGTIITHTSQIGALQSADTALDIRLDAAEGTIITHTSQIGALQWAETNLDVRLGLAESVISIHTNLIFNLENADTALDIRLDALEAIDHAAPTGNASAFYDPTTHTLIQSGIAATSSGGTATITFGTAYTWAPNVVPTSFWESGFQHATGIDIENITTTYFTVRAGYISSGDTVWEPAAISFCWIAIGTKT